ncbi:MAG: hypothetical protein F2681_09055 [Actinobacteria bacterium]|uniref:Unannotated protein n=1 Tax=freshwater metagenome TaxID=449393 RepID=A0A6J6A4U7_9ZZZZ|nr:hypothetical protein [Actinomycetota bacterium]MSW77967.1 hypothetical protein [Actinomycetota bacterium]MSX92913.1 hypothetical protein [Actinomycetota bacterium]MSZ83277.1 hypothetical protein [Actinomycetota bacterium]MTB18210.1 hypothetical protein [Actinomycetota bacterium]
MSMTTGNGRGQFDWSCVAGALEMRPSDYLGTEPILGLRPSQTFVYGSVRDGDGNIWSPMRRFMSGDGGHEKLLLQTNADSDAMHVNRASKHSATGFGVQRSFADGVVQFANDPDAQGQPFAISVTADTFHWVEDGVLELTGTAVKPGLHWHLPDTNKGMYYVSQIFEVEGRILDKEVRGFIPMDQLYMDGVIYEDDIFIGDEAELVWYTWATRYLDGSFEGGHFMLGHRHLGFAVVYDEHGSVVTSTDLGGEVTLDGEGPWPTRIDLTAGGQQWEFLPDPRGRMVDLMPIPNPQIEGRWRRRGDTREPAHWFAWGEIASVHGTTRRLTPPT